MDRTPTPPPDQDSDAPETTRRFEASKLSPREVPSEPVEPTPETVGAEMPTPGTTGPGTRTPGTTQPEPVYATPAEELEYEPILPGGRTFAGGRIQMVGFPGCLIVSVVLSILLSLILNLLV